MSSREIAELTGKRQDHVMRDIRNMIVELHGEEGLPKFWDTYRNEQNGQLYPEFRLPKDLTITLVSGYNVQMRYAITKRWMELEAQQAPKLPTTFAEALRLAAELEEQKEQLRLQNEAMKPAATVGAEVGMLKKLTIPDFARKLPRIKIIQAWNKAIIAAAVLLEHHSDQDPSLTLWGVAQLL